MRFRSTVAVVSASGLLLLLAGAAIALAQEEILGRVEEIGVQEERPRRDDRPGEPSRKGSAEARLRGELDELRRLLEAERGARRRAEARLEAIREGPMPRDRGPIERERIAEEGFADRIERREVPGEIEVAAAWVEAARARLRAAEVRRDGALRRLAVAERRGETAEPERIEAQVAVAEAEAGISEARARLVEAEARLGRARKTAGEPASDATVTIESKFTVDDALETAEKVIDLLRRFRFDEDAR